MCSANGSRIALPKTALVHDWLPVYAGAERVLEQMIQVRPSSDLFSLIEFLSEEERGFLQGKDVTTSFLQHLPLARQAYRYYLPLAPLALEQFDLSDYPLVLSSSYAVAKGALTSAHQLHVSYVHSPVRYAWDLYHQYLRTDGLGRGLKGLAARVVLHYLRLFDAASARRVDLYVANSQHVARRIWKTYRRRAEVIYPPVDLSGFTLEEQKQDYYVTVSRLVSYKRVDLVVDAFSNMPGRKLVVIGDGPDAERLAARAGSNVELLGYQPAEVLRRYLRHARAFVYAAEEDFGIAPVEAQACGTPVIAYGRGGVCETVKDEQTGLLFQKQSAAHLQEAVQAFERQEERFDPERIRRHAEQFGVERFRRELRDLLSRAWARFRQRGSLEGPNFRERLGGTLPGSEVPLEEGVPSEAEAGGEEDPLRSPLQEASSGEGKLQKKEEARREETSRSLL